jgi:hypothetical protein
MHDASMPGSRKPSVRVPCVWIGTQSAAAPACMTVCYSHFGRARSLYADRGERALMTLMSQHSTRSDLLVHPLSAHVRRAAIASTSPAHQFQTETIHALY